MSEWCSDMEHSMSSTSASSISSTSTSSSTSASTDWWCGGSGQVKWLTYVLVGASQMSEWCSNAVLQWYSGRGQVTLLTDVVPVDKLNDWLKWWQGASQMGEWCGDMVTLYL